MRVYNDEASFIDVIKKKAAAVYDRHLTLTRFINEVLGVDETIAEKDACRIEHIISPETFAGIKGMLKD